MQAQQLAAAKRRILITLSLAGRLIPWEVRAAIHALTETQTAGEYDAKLLKTLAVFDRALDDVRQHGGRREALLAFRSLAAGEVFIDVLAALATEADIADAVQSATPKA
jgi:hypothetical protein